MQSKISGWVGGWSKSFFINQKLLKIKQSGDLCGIFQAPLRLLLIWAIIYKDAFMISTLRTVFVINLHIKSQFKGDSFEKKFPTHVLGAPYCWPFRTNNGLPLWTHIAQFAQNGPIKKNFSNFWYKIQNKRGSL